MVFCLAVSNACHIDSSYIKSKGQEWIGVAPLKNKMGFLQSDNKSKAEILTEPFQSVFTFEKSANTTDVTLDTKT
jgi:hypothetical protein